ncbi:hypothetical protein E8E13_010108 [Curvularia kusanoi]|uniref:Protein kinase domain-containing protein n=1 Tax=Curvularia kusanoi TaxID=90978 RepID=A0A9P4TI41_CURKU|nr:hypothetical protein E8E13_010108 [Curvularia kusanoi]
MRLCETRAGSTSAGSSAQPAGLQRQPSFSSFPPSRSPSVSVRNDPRKARSPQPPSLPEDDLEQTAFPSRSSAQDAGMSSLRSQYPADAVERHVEYILVASFDIDRGSIMENQYPAAISGDETTLAELMLPDQVHARAQDWTVFFLHKDTTTEEEEKEARRERRRKRRRLKEGEDANGEAEGNTQGDDEVDDEDTEGSDEGDDPDGPPLVYVLNLVNTKQDKTVKRGAIVKAMAICTRHSFLHIYKPLLLLALEEYFRHPVMETLASLYNALNAMDLSLLPKLSGLETFVLHATDAKDMFVEKFEQMIRQQKACDAQRTSLSSTDSAPPKRITYTLPRDTHEFESKINYNGIPVPVKVPSALSPETVGDFSLIKLIQTFSTPHATSPQPFALHPHLTTSGAYTHPIIVLVNALLTQKRIIFIGHNRPSSEVAEAVLAACALASGGILRGFVRHAFPYTDLTKVDDLLKVPGFIAGVTNPTFSFKPEWWDVLCDLPTGRMKISNRIEPAAPTDGSAYFTSHGIPVSGAGAPMSSEKPGGVDTTGDNAFMENLQLAIANRAGETAIRARWRSWVLKFTRITAAFEETVYGASALYIGSHETDAGAYGVSGHGYVWPDEHSRLRELAANVHRIEGWRSTRSYYSCVQDLARGWGKRPVRGIDLHHQHDKLRCLKLSHDQSAAIYLALSRCVEEAGAPPSSAADAEPDPDLVSTPRALANDPSRLPGPKLQSASNDVLETIKNDWTGMGKDPHVEFKRGEKAPLQKGRQLGSGVAGVVHETTIRGHCFAWKIISSKRNAKLIDRSEINILMRLSHVHMIQSFGTYTQQRDLGILLYPVASCDLEIFFEDVEAFCTSQADDDQKARLKDVGYTLDPTAKYKAWPIYTQIGCLVTALAYLHSERIRHKDIKPSNILLKRGKLFLSDFGLARDFSKDAQSVTQTGGGTPIYFAPEVAALEYAGRAADVFSLGCVLLEIFILHRDGSFDRLNENRKEDQRAFHANLENVDKWLPPEHMDVMSPRDYNLVRAIRTMIFEDPNSRPTCDQVRHDLSFCEEMAKNGPESMFQECCRIPYISTLKHEEALHARDESLIQALSKAKEEYNSLEQSLTGAINRQASEVARLEGERDSLKQELTDSKSQRTLDVTKLKKKRDNLQQKLTDSERQFISDRAKFKENVYSLQHQLNEAQSYHSSEIAKMEEERVSVERQLTEQNEQTRCKLEETEVNLQKANAAHSAKEAQVEKTQAENQALKTQLRAVEEAMQTLSEMVRKREEDESKPDDRTGSLSGLVRVMTLINQVL